MDRSRLREVAREFELRVILQRLEEELGADFVPDAKVEEELDVSAEAGGVEDLAEGEVALAIAGDDLGRLRRQAPRHGRSARTSASSPRPSAAAA